ncbi:Guanosine-diphosphatase [Phlyctochytrium bullatum]|nr:Guanosine-diphosphatase [Phlyctochytrium bullatum]
MTSPKTRRRGSSADITIHPGPSAGGKGDYDRLPTTNSSMAYPPQPASIAYTYPVKRIAACLGVLALCTFLLFTFVIPYNEGPDAVKNGSHGKGLRPPVESTDEDKAASKNSGGLTNSTPGKPKQGAGASAPPAAVVADAESQSANPNAVPPTTFHSPVPCKQPKVPGRPLVQHALMIDAGSTGSRIHVYKFHFCDGAQPTLLGEIFKQLKPGLSSFADDPEGAAKSLDPLMKEAEEAVPAEMRGCTPVAVKATAGLRLVGEKKSRDVLEAVRRRLETKYGFRVIEGDEGVGVMDGTDEGVYAWITVNYLLKRITTPERRPTAAIMDLGGGSTQIVFEPLVSDPPLAPGDHRYDLKFNGRNYVLYQHSYLGYGLMEGRKSLLRAAVKKSVAAGGSKKKGALEPKVPCLPEGYALNVTVSRAVLAEAGLADDGRKDGDVQLTVKGTGAGFAACSQYVASHLFDKDPEICQIDPCSWDGVHQPPMALAFPEPDGDIYAFSYIYDRTVELGYFVDDAGNPTPFSADKVRDLGVEVCGVGLDGKVHLSKAGGKKKEGVDAPRKPKMAVMAEPAACMDLGFIYHLLATGYELRGARTIRTAKKIDGIETGWCLGAAIRVIDEMIGGAVGGLCKA